MKRTLIFLVSALTLATLLLACTSPGGAMSVADGWVRPMPKGQNGAIYFTIQNDTDKGDQLLAVKSDIASSVGMHLSSMNDDGVMSMLEQESVSIPAGKTVTFEPGGLHVMLIDLRKDLALGESFPIVLSFEQAGDITIQVEIKALP